MNVPSSVSSVPDSPFAVGGEDAERAAHESEVGDTAVVDDEDVLEAAVVENADVANVGNANDEDRHLHSTSTS